MADSRVTEIANRYGLDAKKRSALEEEHRERMAICTVEGGLSEEEARVVALADCERWAETLAKVRP